MTLKSLDRSIKVEGYDILIEFCEVRVEEAVEVEGRVVVGIVRLLDSFAGVFE